MIQGEIDERLAGRYWWHACKLGGESYEFCLNVFWKDTDICVLVFAFRDGDALLSGWFWISAKFLVQISSVKSPRRGSSMKESSWWWWWCCGSHRILKNECRMGLVFKPSVLHDFYQNWTLDSIFPYNVCEMQLQLALQIICREYKSCFKGSSNGIS